MLLRFTFFLALALLIVALAYVLRGTTKSSPISDPSSFQADVALEPEKLDPDTVSVISPPGHQLQTDSQPELIETVYGRGLEFSQNAYAAAEETMQLVDSQSVLRWRPTHVNPAKLVAGVFDGRDGAVHERTPAELVSITPFDDISLLVNLTDFDDVGWGATWMGEIVGSSDGSVTIHVTPDEAGRPVVQMYVVSSLGNFNVAPTGLYGHYVAIEMNPTYRAKLD